MHSNKTSKSFSLALSSIENVGTGCCMTGIDSEVSQTANKWVSSDLECQSGEWFIISRLTGRWFTIWQCTCDSFNICWSWQVVNYCIQQQLYALVLISGTAQYWEEFRSHDTLTDRSLDFFNCWFFTFKNLHHQFIVIVSNSFEKFHSLFFCFFLELIFDFDFLDICTKVICVHFLLHCDKVNDSAECAFSTYRHLNCSCLGAKTITNGIDTHPEVSTCSVHLVGEDDTWYTVFRSLSPDCFCLRFYTCFGVKNCDGTIEYAQGSFNFSCEVYVAWCINDVDLAVFPVTCCRSGSDCNTTFLFLRHPVHLRSAIVSFTDLVDLTCVIQNTLCCRCLTGIDMSHDSDITNLV